MKTLSRSLLNEVQFLIIFMSMLIMIVVVGISMALVSYTILKDLRNQAIMSANELASLLEQPLYNVDNEACVRIAKAFLSSGKISGIDLQSTAGGRLYSDLSGQDSLRIPKISKAITAQNMPLGSFVITFSDEQIRNSQSLCLMISLTIIISVLLANVAASRYIARRVRQPFQTILLRSKNSLRAIIRPRLHLPSIGISTFWSLFSTGWLKKFG